jgi:hypothetical protein
MKENGRSAKEERAHSRAVSTRETASPPSSLAPILLIPKPKSRVPQSLPRIDSEAGSQRVAPSSAAAPTGTQHGRGWAAAIVGGAGRRPEVEEAAGGEGMGQRRRWSSGCGLGRRSSWRAASASRPTPMASAASGGSSPSRL